MGRPAPPPAGGGRVVQARGPADSNATSAGPAVREPEAPSSPYTPVIFPRALIKQYTNLGGLNLDEEALGTRLAALTQSDPDVGLVRGVLAELDPGDQAQVATAMIEQLEHQQALEQLVQSDAGLDVLSVTFGPLRRSQHGETPARLVMRALFPPPRLPASVDERTGVLRTIPSSSFPVLSREQTPKIIAYEHDGVYRDLSSTIIGEIPVEATMSPLDFIGFGFPALGRAGVRALLLARSGATLARSGVTIGRGGLTGAGRVLARDARALVKTQFTREAFFELKSLISTGASGTFAAVLNLGRQLYDNHGDFKKVRWGSVTLEFALGAVTGAYVGRVMAAVPLPKNITFLGLFRPSNVAILIRQQGLIAPLSLAANLIRSAYLGKSWTDAVKGTVIDSIASVPLNGVLQWALLGPLGRSIFRFSPGLTPDQRVKTTRANLLRSAIAQVRQYLIREVAGLNTEKAQHKPAAAPL